LIYKTGISGSKDRSETGEVIRERRIYEMARSETTIEPEKGKDTQITNNNNALTLLLVA
jgi:hypothetical protein